MGNARTFKHINMHFEVTLKVLLGLLCRAERTTLQAVRSGKGLLYFKTFQAQATIGS